MNNINKYTTTIILAGLLTMAGTGCKKFLELTPLDNRVEQNFYKTEKDANEALNSVYDALQWHTNAGGGGFSPDPMMADIASDDSYAGGGSRSDSPEMIQIDQQKLLTNNSLIRVYWANHYTGIYRANLLLQKLPGITMSDAAKAKITAECKFLRAFFYFDLAKWYGNIPLILAPQAPSEYCTAQATPAETFNQIAKDLVEAIPVLDKSDLRTSKAHATRWSAEGLLGRIYLFYKGVYKAELQAGSVAVNGAYVLTQLKDLIANSGHDLLTNYADNFTKANEFSKESVWEISYSNDNPWFDWNYIQGGEGNMQPQMQGPRIDGDPSYNTGWSFAPVAQELYDAYEANDPRRAATIINMETDLKGKVTTGYQHTGFFSKKYTTTNEYRTTAGQYELNWGNNYRSIRYSDVLLMAAELDLANGGGSAQGYLNKVRGRVSLPNKTVSLAAIYQERRAELALEGIRYWDLLRQGLPAAAQAITISGKRGPGYNGDQVDYNVTFNQATKGLFPIPQSERDQCPVLKPNF
ncbi:RagB/SusD family nutrient uptake outer membrane protein [Mucilaginibacter galii]|uniref:Membrane protein n=1 Tax=Mucilaginibacter galii TaxID=2005073 RepID=A0A917N0N3_9SPHI|nr:RagB/SusD family nutrient uptake outer membrane protein [Mucilaginibacter galii]GGI49998.1 membrane protein [Mucilaginibacter galii]